ncbi:MULTISPECIES: CBS domain-containing protein [Halomonadaceae]|uniref:CBS domain-containing protein n=1 Tax=Halomonadaceae TaxID=28256 RepID=UPI0015824B82|nr:MULTISPECIES: CBS domain-containing protein [Halomonas]MDI4638217.1 CBS domain-containing protein [Halomonas sp. BMC7]NUJ59217.1 CBS domain-containing protein [Halomonas taeanensis]
MRAVDVMTTTVVSVSPETGVQEIARLLLDHHISAVPVIDEDRHLLGMVSEGDLMSRAENQAEKPTPWWLALVSAGPETAASYIRTHGHTARDIMTHPVVDVEEDVSVADIARLLEKRHIKRVPVTRDGKLVGIVSRSNLLQGLAITPPASEGTVDDRSLREALSKEIENKLNTVRVNVIVKDGVVELWGLVASDEEMKAVQLAAENQPGVKRVENNMSRMPLGFGAF